MTPLYLTQSPEHIVILGPSKTGTTGLYSAVKQGLRDAGIPARTIFEPSAREPIDSVFRYAPSVPVMTKVTMDRLDRVVPDLRVFDRRVMTVRDPRDIVISSLLFRPLTVAAIQRADESAVRQFVAALEEKETDPASHSVRSLFDLAYRLGLGRRPFQGLAEILDRQRELLDAGLVEVVRYERFVEGELDELSKYLGFEVVNAAAHDSGWIGHITRSKSSGEFSRWFLQEDVDYFNRRYGSHLRTFGYDLDATLDTEAGIDPSTSSAYVLRRYLERRDRLNADQQRTWHPRDVRTPEELHLLTERAEDGDRRACLRVTRVLLEGDLGPADPAAALDWARYAAQLGSFAGMRLTARLLRGLDPDEPALRREQRMWSLQTESASGQEVAQLQSELDGLRSSARYRLGSALADAARNPRRKALPALRIVLSALRRRLRRSPAKRARR